jgi:hypothetical protein
MQSHDSHSQTVVTANFWRGDYSCTTPAQPDLGFDPRMTLVFRNWPEKRNPEQERELHRPCRLVLVSCFVMSSEYASPARTETSLILLCLELEIPRLRSE